MQASAMLESTGSTQRHSSNRRYGWPIILIVVISSFHYRVASAISSPENSLIQDSSPSRDQQQHQSEQFLDWMGNNNNNNESPLNLSPTTHEEAEDQERDESLARFVEPRLALISMDLNNLVADQADQLEGKRANRRPISAFVPMRGRRLYWTNQARNLNQEMQLPLGSRAGSPGLSSRSYALAGYSGLAGGPRLFRSTGTMGSSHLMDGPAKLRRAFHPMRGKRLMMGSESDA